MRNGERCTATAKGTGVRCRRRRHPGAAVCVKHGAGAPQVRRSAAERVAALVDPSINALQRALTCRDWGAVVRSAKDLLDRAGVGRHDDTVSRADVSRLFSAVVAAILDNVSDPGEQRAITAALRRISLRIGDRDVTAGIPVPQAPARVLRLTEAAPPPPEPPPRPKEVVL